MARPKKSLADRLLAAQLAINNSISDDEIKTAVAQFGYDETRLNAGKALLDNANKMQYVQKKEYGDQYQATDALTEAWNTAEKTYMRFVKVARIALKSDHALYLKLDLVGTRKKTLSEWMAQARLFYINALEDDTVLEKMALYGMEQEKLEAGKALLEQTEAANAAQEKEKGQARQATIERDKAMDELDEWLSDYIAIARIALEEKPQLLEKLGIYVAS